MVYYYNFFNSRGMKTSIVVRIQQTLVPHNITIQPLLTHRTPTIYSHEIVPKDRLTVIDTPHHIVRAIFRSLIEKYARHS